MRIGATMRKTLRMWVHRGAQRAAAAAVYGGGHEATCPSFHYSKRWHVTGMRSETSGVARPRVERGPDKPSRYMRWLRPLRCGFQKATCQAFGTTFNHSHVQDSAISSWITAAHAVPRVGTGNQSRRLKSAEEKVLLSIILLVSCPDTGFHGALGAFSALKYFKEYIVILRTQHQG